MTAALGLNELGEARVAAQPSTAPYAYRTALTLYRLLAQSTRSTPRGHVDTKMINDRMVDVGHNISVEASMNRWDKLSRLLAPSAVHNSFVRNHQRAERGCPRPPRWPRTCSAEITLA